VREFHFVNKRAYREYLDIPHAERDQFGVIQLSINGSPAYRVVYSVKYANRLDILHSWAKTSNHLDRPAMDVIKIRYQEMLNELIRDGLNIKQSCDLYQFQYNLLTKEFRRQHGH
jgi:phage-related protein